MYNFAIIGQGPSSKSDPTRVLRGRSGNVIRALLRFTPEEFGKVERLNLAPFYEGKNGKGDAFTPDPTLVKMAREMCSKREIAILLGYAVGKALNVRADYFEPVLKDKTIYFIVPHPSGINRWWNEPANRRRAARFFRRLKWNRAKTRSSPT